jgi:hypothetical protein
VRTARYFEEPACGGLRKRPYLKRDWCESVINNCLRRKEQPDGRIKFWGHVTDLGGRILRVVTLSDGETPHHAFIDRDFKP